MLPWLSGSTLPERLPPLLPTKCSVRLRLSDGFNQSDRSIPLGLIFWDACSSTPETGTVQPPQLCRRSCSYQKAKDSGEREGMGQVHVGRTCKRLKIVRGRVLRSAKYTFSPSQVGTTYKRRYWLWLLGGLRLPTTVGVFSSLGSCHNRESLQPRLMKTCLYRVPTARRFASFVPLTDGKLNVVDDASADWSGYFSASLVETQQRSSALPNLMPALPVHLSVIIRLINVQ